MFTFLLYQYRDMVTGATVQVLLSTFNGSAYLAELIESVLAQRGVDVRLLIRDDDSTDRTLEVLEQYAIDPRVTIERGDTNLGAARSFLWLLRNCSSEGEFTALADQDDVWLDQKLARAVSALSGVDRTKPAMYCSALTLVSPEARPLGSWCAVRRTPSFANATVQNVATGCTIVFNQPARELLVSRLPRSVDMHDWWIYQAIAGTGTVLFDPLPSILYRQHDANLVGAAPSGLRGAAAAFTRFSGRGFRLRPMTQLAELEGCFADLWSAEHRAVVRRTLEAPTSGSARLKVALGGHRRFQSLRQELVFRILVALGRF